MADLGSRRELSLPLPEFSSDVFKTGPMASKTAFKSGLPKLIPSSFFLTSGKVTSAVPFLSIDVEFFPFEASCVLLESV